MAEFAFHHECEGCGLRVLLTPELAFSLGWDYPPRMGQWGIVSPRTCGSCGVDKTVWWELVMNKTSVEDLTDEQYNTVIRILNEKDPYAPAT